MAEKSSNTFWHRTEVSVKEKEAVTGQRGLVFLLTGLSGSGKSTIAVGVERRLHEIGLATVLLDGDNLRHGLNSDLGFSPEDRRENVRRITEVSKLFSDSGLVTLVSIIAPYASDRKQFKRLLGDSFYEVYVNSTIEHCKQRDPKGLYAKVEREQIENFTGISAPYEIPKIPALQIDTLSLSVEESRTLLFDFISDRLKEVRDG